MKVLSKEVPFSISSERIVGISGADAASRSSVKTKIMLGLLETSPEGAQAYADSEGPKAKKAAKDTTRSAGRPLFANPNERVSLTLTSGLLHRSVAPQGTQYPTATLREAERRIKKGLSAPRYSAYVCG